MSEVKRFTREEALRLHRQMWTDMQKKLGDNPHYHKREKFKTDWCKKHFPDEHISENCFLCEYANQVNPYGDCEDVCPIDWGGTEYGWGCTCGKVLYKLSPISEILALPEREVE